MLEGSWTLGVRIAHSLTPEGEAMTVGELIERLRGFPPEMPVVVNGGRSERANGRDCQAAEVVDQYSNRDYSDFWHIEYYPDVPLDEGERRRKAVNVRA